MSDEIGELTGCNVMRLLTSQAPTGHLLVAMHEEGEPGYLEILLDRGRAVLLREFINEYLRRIDGTP